MAETLVYTHYNYYSPLGVCFLINDRIDMLRKYLTNAIKSNPF